MSGLPVVTARDLARVARRLDFELHRQSGSHAVYVRREDGARVVIPMHPGRSMKPKTLLAILDDFGITPDELRRLL
jgi:predicted RNA binding protein YcfA (HicA-like mRNA interferase family)